MKNLDQLISVVSANPLYNGFFQEVDWSYYIQGIRDEINEVEEELQTRTKDILPNGVSKLEDELGDVLWDCLSLIEKLNYDGLIDKNKICEHTRNKFLERLPFVRDKNFASENEICTQDYWGQAKKKQKQRGITPQQTNL